jgi:antitoxin (DNA-binding transcriptional repressor) of toxin-antitoxin stability system
MKTHISATQAVRTFSDLINRVRYRGEEFIVERGGEPVCQIIPARPVVRTVADLVQLLRTAPQPDEEYWDILEDITKKQPPLPSSPWQR